MTQVVNGIEEAEFDEDGEQIGLTPFALTLLSTLATAVTVSTYKKDVRDNLGALLVPIVTYMQLTDEQLDMWESDPNKFIAEDEDDSMCFSVRNAAVDLVVCVKYCVLC